VDDKTILYTALQHWMNYIQTGDIVISTDRALKMGEPERCRMINSDQQDFIERLKDLQHDILNRNLKL